MNTFTIFLILITFVCFLLIVAIMIQNPKGGGLDSSFGGSTVVGGVKNTNDFLDKSTWTLGGLLIALILLSSMSFSGGGVNGDSKVLDPNAIVTPIAPVSTPETNEVAPSNNEGTPATEEAPIQEAE